MGKPIKVRLINRHGEEWEFDSMGKATPHIKPSERNKFWTTTDRGEQVRIYDDRDRLVSWEKN